MNYNEEIGLWHSPGPGHSGPTKDLEIVHAGPNAASRLLAAAQVDALSEIDVPRVLGALKEMVWDGDDGKCGCMSWYWEEDQPYDTNAAFFTGTSLIVLRKQFYDALDAESQTMLDEILAKLSVWFDHSVEHATYHYPNKYLGDLGCGWLLLEILGRVESDSRVAEHMERAATYWLDEGWGWGEHLSDGYTRVCLNELSVLLLLSEHLPESLLNRYSELMAALLAIEDAYDGGPRVPAFRSYAFQAPPRHVTYRDQVQPWEKAPTQFSNSPDLGNLLHGLGWHDLMPKRKPAEENPRVACFGGAVANARIEDDIRIGSVTRFPVMPSAEHPGWGLSWQSFPVAFSRREMDYGFLQWEVEESGVTRAHPANGGPMAHIPKSLTAATASPVTGSTCAIQRGGNLLVLRLMRVVPKVWATLVDRFRLVEQTAEVSEETDGNWSSLNLAYPERTVSVHHLRIDEGEQRVVSRPDRPDRSAAIGGPQLSQNKFDGLDWSVATCSPDLQATRLFVNLWAFSIEGPIVRAPKVTAASNGPTMARSAEEAVRDVAWSWPSTDWQIQIDPLATEPMRELT